MQKFFTGHPVYICYSVSKQQTEIKQHRPEYYSYVSIWKFCRTCLFFSHDWPTFQICHYQNMQGEDSNSPVSVKLTDSPVKCRSKLLKQKGRKCLLVHTEFACAFCTSTLTLYYCILYWLLISHPFTLYITVFAVDDSFDLQTSIISLKCYYTYFEITAGFCPVN
jgi:hypothetical protein